ncbi:MAG: FG-GAP repeat domain-containing protein [Rhizobiaceae bacterium]
MKKFFKLVGMGLVSVILLLLVALVARSLYDRQIDYAVDLDGTAIPKFSELELSHDHSHSDDTSLPFTAGAAIDIDGDGTDELFIGGGHGQDDVLYRYKNGKFDLIKNVAGIKKLEGGSSLGALVLDVNDDRKQDLIVTRPTGIWLYVNKGASFSVQKLDAPLLEDTTPLSIAVADVNNDGHFDMYVSGYIRNDLVEGLNIFNKEGYGGTSALLVNRGDNTFEDQTEKRGLYYKHNTFQSVFIDADLDGDVDLIVAHDTGQVRTWENDGDGNFTNVSNPTSSEYTYPMGIAVADYDNDSRVDFFFSNVGSSPPHFLVKGDLRPDQQHNWKWLFFQNKGDMKFDDVAEAKKLADYEFAWGAVFEDLNLDGREDLLVSQNFVTAPFHKIPLLRLPGRLLVQTSAGEFAEVGEEAGVVNRRYSISPVTSDFNNDGQPDIVHINIAGRSKAFLSTGSNSNGYLKIKLPRNVSSIGAMATITLEDGAKLYRPYVSGEGLAADSAETIIVGLGRQKAKLVSVKFIDGHTFTRVGPLVNEEIVVGQ